MKLENISIKNFKSIKNLNLSFSDNLYCLIGKNEIGKSNILQSIALLGETHHIESKVNTDKLNRILKSATIIGRFRYIEDEKNELTQILRLFKPRLTPGAVTNAAQTNKYDLTNFKAIKVTVRKNLGSNNEYAIELKDDTVLTKSNLIDATKTDDFVKRIMNLVPSISYFEKEDFLIRPVTPDEIQQTPEDPSLQSFTRLFLLGGLDEIQRLTSTSVEEVIEIKESVSAKVNDLLRKYYKQDTTLKIRIESHNGHFSLHFKDDYHPLNSLEDRSTGFQYFFAFLINKIYLMEFGKKDSIYLFDEPGLSLHPTGQKDFIKLLEEIGKENQILYTTHSPFSINRMRPTRVWVIEKSVEKGTFLNPKPYQKNWRPLRSSLGIDVSDSFFYGDRSLLVEGPEDRIYIGCMFNFFSDRGDIKLNSDLLSIIDSGSINNMPAMVQILLDEERPLFVFMDDDDTSVYNRLKKKEQEIKNPDKFTILRTTDIFKDAVSIEDLIPHQLYIQAVKNYLDYLLAEDVIKFTTPETFMPNLGEIKPPKKYQSISDIVKKHFLNSDGTELDSKTPISKVGIAHEFEKLFKLTMMIIDDQEEKNCLKLVQLITAKLGL